MDTLTNTIDTFRERVNPTPDEKAALIATFNDIRDQAAAQLKKRDLDADIVQCGSTARGTYVTGDKDIDIFVCFSPSDLTTNELEETIIDIGNDVFENPTVDYAAHPYVKTVYDGFDIDLVPCYAVESAENIKSAVDRSPFHTKYLRERLTDDLAEDVRVAKHFLKTIDLYGSDDTTEGFSGYLTELMVIEAGGFVNFLEMVVDWEPPVFFDPEQHSTESFDDSLVVIDPVDPSRNVAAIVSRRQVARLQHYARAFLDTETEECLKHETPSLSPLNLHDQLCARGTSLLAVTFSRPVENKETLVPQLKRSLNGLTDLLDRHEFTVLRSTWFFSDSEAVLFAETTPQKHSNTTLREGPPVENTTAATNFLDVHTDKTVHITDNGTYAVEVEREHTTPKALVEDTLITYAKHGKAVGETLKNNFTVIDIAQKTPGSTELLNTYTQELTTFLHPRT